MRKVITIRFRCTKEERTMYERCAKKEGLTLSEWLRSHSTYVARTIEGITPESLTTMFADEVMRRIDDKGVVIVHDQEVNVTKEMIDSLQPSKRQALSKTGWWNGNKWIEPK